MNLKTCNVEAGFPSLDEARRLVLEEIRKSKREGVRVLKVIHGYGSSGKGGTLNHGLKKSFALRKKEGVIKDYIPGENFTIWCALQGLNLRPPVCDTGALPLS
jgi:hypothetical protein